MNPKRKSDSSKTVWSPDDGKTIQFRYHRTSLVEYTESTLLVKLWDSQGSVTFINELTPNGVHARLHRGRTIVNGMEDNGFGLLFRCDGDQYVVDPKTVRPQFQIKVDKKIAAQVQKRLRPFLKYVEARRALEGLRTPTGSMRPNYACFTELQRNVDCPTAWPQLYQVVGAIAPAAIQREFVWFEGGVKKVQLPIGELPTVSVYDGYIQL